MALTKVSGGILDPGINVAGIVTATGFDGPFTGGSSKHITAGVVTATSLDLNGNGDISGNLVIGGNLTANGDFTTLNTTLREVELLRVDAQNDNVAAGIITQRGSGDILNLFDTSTEVFTVKDGGNVGIGSQIPQAKFVVSNAGVNGFEFNPNFNSNNSIIASYNRSGGGSYSQLTLSASQHIFTQGGTEYGRFNASAFTVSGNLGIGFTTPQDSLTLRSTDNDTSIRIIDPSNSNYGAHFSFYNNENELRIGGIENTVKRAVIRINRDADDDALCIDTAGRVGIGTTTPSALLTVGDDIFKVPETGTIATKRNMAIQSVYPILQFIDTDSNSDYQIQNANGDFGIRDTSNSANRLVIRSDGDVGIGSDTTGGARLRVHQDGLDTMLQQWGGNLGSTGLRFMQLYTPATDNGNDYFKFHTANAFKFVVDATDALVMNSSGLVGIGTDIPTKQLHVFDSSATSTTARANTVARFLSNASNADCNIQLSNGVDHSAQIGIVGNGAEFYIAQDGVERWRIDSSGHLLPGAVGSYNIGSATAEIGDVYIADDKRFYAGSDQNLSLIHI